MNKEQVSHALVVSIKELAAELGKVPTRDEFITAVPKSKYQIEQTFKTFSVLLQAAGLDSRNRSSSQDRPIFMQADIDLAIKTAQQKDQPLNQPEIKKTYLCIGDLHYPFADPKAVDWAIGLAKQLKPDVIVQVGDAYDMLSWGSFPKSQMHFTAKQEIELAYEGLSSFWARMQKAAPKADCYLLHGNHTIRPLKQLLAQAPALEVFLSVRRWFEFPGVKFIEDHREELVLEGICFIHGYRSKLGDHRDYTLMSVCCGHTHRGGTVFRRVRDKVLFELNCGYLGDPDSKGFTYTPQKMVEWTQGVGVIDRLGPRFVPYPGK